MREPAAHRAPRSYDAMLADIESGLASGVLAPGTQLPGERVLAERYGISRASVREGIRYLDIMGILSVPRNSGPRSGPVVISEPSSGMSDALRLHVAARRLPVADVVQTRLLLETWAAGSARVDEHPEALATARELLLAMDEPGIELEAFHALDARFHVALSALAGNAVIETMMESVSGAIGEYIHDAIASLDHWPEVVEQLRAQHHAIFGALCAGRNEQAAGLLHEHIHWLHDRARAE